MASYNIPEQIIGIPLFVPNTNDFFSVQAGGMPNGDDCLKIHGVTSSNYKAFQPAQTLSPNVFLSRTPVYSQTFWFKAPFGAFTNTEGNGILFGVMRASSTSLTDGSVVWAFSTSGTVTFRSIIFRHGTNAAVLAAPAATPGLFDNQWHLVTITNSGTLVSIFYDDAALAVASNAPPGAPPTTTEQFVCIGPYSNTYTGWAQDWFMGKWAFHNHVLNQTERALLYNAMTA